MIVEALIVAGAVVGVAFLRARMPQEGRSDPPAVSGELVERIGAVEAEQRALRRMLTDLEGTVEARHRKVTGMLSVARRKDRSGGEDDGGAGPEGEDAERDAALRALEASLTAAAPRDFNDAAPVGGATPGRIRPLHRRTR